MSRKIINAYPRFKEFNDLAMAGDNVAAVRKGLDFLRFVGKEYEWKQVYDHSKWEGMTSILGRLKRCWPMC